MKPLLTPADWISELEELGLRFYSNETGNHDFWGLPPLELTPTTPYVEIQMVASSPTEAFWTVWCPFPANDHQMAGVEPWSVGTSLAGLKKAWGAALADSEKEV